MLLNLYENELKQLLKKSINKTNDWNGWYRIEILEDMISKYKLLKTS